MSPDPATIQCVYDLAGRVPELRSALDGHVQDYGELLPHLFMSDVTRFVAENALAGQAPVVKAVLVVLERYLAFNEEQAVGLISVSFAENLVKFEGAVDQVKG